MEERPWLAHYDPGVPRTIEYREVPVTRLLDEAAAAHPERLALVFLNARLSYGQLLDEVQRCATALARLGAGPGTRVAIQLPNLPQTVIAYYAVLSIGAEVVMTNPLYTARELEHQWNDSECTFAVVTDYNYVQKIRELRPRIGVEHFIVASIPEYLRFPLSFLAPFKLGRQDPALWAKVPADESVHRFRDLVRSTPPTPPGQRLEMDQRACLQYTGGTTGASKGAVLTHRNLSVNVQQNSAWFAGIKSEHEVLLTCLPLFHCFGMTVGMNWAVEMAATMVLAPNPRDIPALVKAITKHRVTIFPGVPALYNALNHHPGIDKVDVSSVKVCISGSAPIPAEVLQRFERLTGSVILEGFGLTETSPVTHCNPVRSERKIGTIGMPMPDTDCQIVDVETGDQVLPPGEEGELCIRGPQVMLGYWNRPEETASSLRDGWLYTGDLAAMDEDGYFRIVGRKKDMIIRGGFKVYPDEVDGVLIAHEGILEAATIGVPDEDKGERVKSFVVLQPGVHLTEEEVRQWCRQHLAPYKVPKEVEVIDELPKSSVMKVLRRELR